jgi:hypothetical protein
MQPVDLLVPQPQLAPEHAHSAVDGQARERGRPEGHAREQGHDHRHKAADAPASVQPLRVLAPASTPALVMLSPSAMRMGIAGRLAIAAGLLSLVWAATLAVTG